MEVSPAHRAIPVRESSQVSAGRAEAREAASRLRFDEEDVYRTGLVATELATNLVKHAQSGELLVRGVLDGGDGEVEILSIDRGPGMTDVTRAMTDGHSTAGTAGNGLGAVKRLSDEFDAYSQPGRGTVILARVTPRRAGRGRRSQWDVAGLCVAVTGEAVSGDSWQLCERTDGVVLILADGLGHGIQAQEASAAAIGAFDPARDVELTGVIENIHSAIRHTRGAAAAVAEIRPRQRVLNFAGVGNIAGSISRRGATRNTVSLNGTLGHHMRTARMYAYPWESDALFIMSSDGLASHWSIDDYPGLRQHHPSVIAGVLYRDHRRQRDDVTVVVAREARQVP